MRVHNILLNYGLEKGYYTPGEYNWCIHGNKIKDYEYASPHTKLARGLIDIARENKSSIAKVSDVYNEFNRKAYKNFFDKGGESLELTKRYFNIQKIRDLKFSENLIPQTI